MKVSEYVCPKVNHGPSKVMYRSLVDTWRKLVEGGSVADIVNNSA